MQATMNANQSSDILNSMINFIKSHGDERVKEIMEQANQDFSIGKEKMCEAEKARLAEKLVSPRVQYGTYKSFQRRRFP